MKLTISLLGIFALITTIGAPPVVQHVDKNEQKVDSKDDDKDDVLNNLEYGRYLKEVVDILEKDPEFKQKIENASLDDIRSGHIAEHLPLVQHNIRTQLDEAKQREMVRLRELVRQKVHHLSERQRLAIARTDRGENPIREFLPKHVDHKNSETFGQLDLERLIKHASKDLDELDQKREQEFKEYEMQKEYQRREKLNKVNGKERTRLQKIHEDILEKKKRHPKVNHPGSVDQMEEVWEKVDNLEPEQFAPKTFFKLHDINGDGFLDEAELDAIMLKEAAKIHDETPDADPVEKQEELNRMRQHVMKEFDKNNDRMLSLNEFEYGMNGTGAKNEQGWQSIEDSTVFSDQEFQGFSDRLYHVSTPIPRHHIPSSPGDQQPQIPPEAAAHPQVAPEVVAQPPVPPQSVVPPQAAAAPQVPQEAAAEAQDPFQAAPQLPPAPHNP